MDRELENIRHKVQALKSITESERSALMEEVSNAQKRMRERDFMIMRLNKDKSIIVNVLKATITDLERSNLQIEDSNKQLLDHQKELNDQQAIIENNSKKLTEKLKELEYSYSELEDFTYIASHDLKSPLRSISGFAYLLQKKYEGQINKEADKFLEFIVSATKHMNEVINALLDYSKVGIKPKDFEEVDLMEIMDIVKNNLSLDIEEANAKINCENLPVIFGDKISMLQLFQNLVANAIKFKSEKPPVIHVKSEREDSIWKVQVIDNGIGMDETYQNKAFFPFQRLEEKNTSGLGLGLAICKKVTKLHDGKIYYTKNSSKGTTFIIELPASGIAHPKASLESV
jgi:light-regulated signal transduction histidine kinase (bacteriophytochrome)